MGWGRAWRFPLLVTAGVFLTALSSFEALFAPKANLWERWAAHDPGAPGSIDHAAWDRLLDAYVSTDPQGVNRFDYGRVGAADREALEAYLAALAAVPISRYRRDEQFAFWVNLYNALTVRLVVERYPVASIRDIDISPGLFADGPWDAKLLAIESAPLSLNDIEHRILRPIWRDPRIHYAVNCASLGCPNLQKEAFTAANHERLLDLGARAYVNHPRGARFEGNRLVVSSIYLWFAEDFGGSGQAVLAHLARYADAPLNARLSRIQEIGGHDYDWALNDPRGG
jgi:hypothetical protein